MHRKFRRGTKRKIYRKSKNLRYFRIKNAVEKFYTKRFEQVERAVHTHVFCMDSFNSKLL